MFMSSLERTAGDQGASALHGRLGVLPSGFGEKGMGHSVLGQGPEKGQCITSLPLAFSGQGVQGIAAVQLFGIMLYGRGLAGRKWEEWMKYKEKLHSEVIVLCTAVNQSSLYLSAGHKLPNVNNFV